MPIYVYLLGLRLSAWHLGVRLFTPGISMYAYHLSLRLLFRCTPAI
jgi:hypothetical protein